MKNNIRIIREKLHDGNWTEYHDSKGLPYSVNRETFYLNYSNGKSIKELSGEIGKAQFETLMTKIESKYLDDFEAYKSQNGLSLYYLSNIKKYIIYSYGEKQPGRYQLFVEAILEN